MVLAYIYIMQDVTKVFVIRCYFCLSSLVGTLWDDSWPKKAHKRSPNWGTWVVRLFRPGILPSSDRPFMFVSRNRNSFFFFPGISLDPFSSTHIEKLILNVFFLLVYLLMLLFEASLADWFVLLPHGGTESSRSLQVNKQQHTQPWIIPFEKGLRELIITQKDISAGLSSVMIKFAPQAIFFFVVCLTNMWLLGRAQGCIHQCLMLCLT